jgi:hypothetical protein
MDETGRIARAVGEIGLFALWVGAVSLLACGALSLVMPGGGVAIYLAIAFAIRGPEHRIVKALARWVNGRFREKTS